MTTTPAFTELDSLKECAARGHFALRQACKMLDEPSMMALPNAIEALRFQLDQLREVLVESIAAHIDNDEEVDEFFSDGRPVVTRVPLDGDVTYHQIWSADPTSERDQPRIVHEFTTQYGGKWRIAILRPGEVEAVEIRSRAFGAPDATTLVAADL